MSRRFLLATLVAGSLGLASNALAQGKDPAAAEALFRDAREAAKRNDFATACPKFAESQRLDPAAGTLLNLADCEEHTGKLADAWQHYRQAAEQLAPTDDRLPMAKDHAASVEKRLAHLTIRLDASSPKGTMVMRDQIELGAASLGTALPVDPGPHTIVARTPSGKEQRTDLTLKEGQNESLTLSVAEGGDSKAAPPASTASSPAAPSSGSSSTAGYVVGGIGAAGIVISLVTGGLALGKKSTVSSECDANKYCTQAGLDAGSSGKTLSTVSTVAFAVGVVGLAAGAYLILSSKPDGSTTALAGSAGADGASLRLMQSF